MEEEVNRRDQQEQLGMAVGDFGEQQRHGQQKTRRRQRVKAENGVIENVELPLEEEQQA
jgi:hypothetical protein